MDYLFLFTIGPVQSFIAQARKTQDLYAGSRILGELAFIAADIAKQHQVALIFPKEVIRGSSVPNRFIGEISGKTEAEMQAIGQTVETAVRKRFKQLADEALNQANAESSNSFDQQIANHLEINWLFHPVEGDDDAAYRKAYKEIETYMASIKNARLFKQYDYNKLEMGERGRKCSLDGERNALFYGKGTNRNYLGQGQIVTKGGFWLNQNEGLSAVSFTKRGYAEKGRHEFPSTAEVAIMNRIQDKKGQFYLFKDCLGDIDFDAQLCFKENMTEKYLSKNGYNLKCSIADLEKQRASIFPDKELSSYYALVAFDGDKMGKFLSGDSEVFKGNDLKHFQGEVSHHLSKFAEVVKDYFKKEDKGAVVYTGGDDFLGFVNLVSLFEVMAWLRQEFHNAVSKPLSEAGYFVENKNFTFSAGVVVAHYKMPLGIALSKARELEKMAKNEGDRDAFAIGVLKKSGEIHETCYEWELGEGLKYWKAIENLVGYFEQGICSETFVRSLSREFYLLKDSDGNVPDNGMVKLELSRLVKKSMTKKCKTKTEEVQQTVETLMLSKNKKSGDLLKLETFTEAVSIALFLKRNRKITKTDNQSTCQDNGSKS
jgi:CRISPR-associated protein Cmr2